MTRRPNASQALALKAAAVAAAARDDEPDEPPTATTAVTEHDASPVAVPSPEPATPDLEQPGTKPIGRPKGRRSVAARQTVYLDDARHAALARLADDRGRSIHSLILEGIDHVIGKPTTPGWR